MNSSDRSHERGLANIQDKVAKPCSTVTGQRATDDDGVSVARHVDLDRVSSPVGGQYRPVTARLSAGKVQIEPAGGFGRVSI